MKRLLLPRAFGAVTALGALLASPGLAAAGTVATGAIAGTVTEAVTGEPVAGLFILFAHVEQSSFGFAITGADGRYTSPPLAPGAYFVQTNTIGRPQRLPLVRPPGQPRDRGQGARRLQPRAAGLPALRRRADRPRGAAGGHRHRRRRKPRVREPARARLDADPRSVRELPVRAPPAGGLGARRWLPLSGSVQIEHWKFNLHGRLTRPPSAPPGTPRSPRPSAPARPTAPPARRR